MSLKIAGAFGGGMARTGGTCGAVTGGLMVIGLQQGQTKTGDNEAKEKTYELSRAFIERFTARNKHLLCPDLLGHDLNTEEGRRAAAERKLFITLCPRYVADATQILEDLLQR